MIRLTKIWSTSATASMSPPLRALLLAAATAGAAAFANYDGPSLESFEFVYQDLRIAGSKPRGRDGYYVVPAGEITKLPDFSNHNSFSNTINGFFAPGGTEVWQAEAAFEWLLATAFGP